MAVTKIEPRKQNSRISRIYGDAQDLVRRLFEIPANEHLHTLQFDSGQNTINVITVRYDKRETEVTI